MAVSIHEMNNATPIRQLQMDTLYTRYDRKIKELKEKRSNWNTVWDKVAHYFMPTHGNFNFQTERIEKDPFVMDSTGRQCLQQLASSIYQSLTNPSARWFELTLKNNKIRIPIDDLGNTELVDISEDVEVINFLKEASDLIYKIFSSPHTNFESSNFELIMANNGYGTGVMYIANEHGDYPQFQHIHLSEIYLEEDYRGRVNWVTRCFKYKAREAYERWKEGAGEQVLYAYQNGQEDKEFEFWHSVHKNDLKGHYARAPFEEHAFASVYGNVSDRKIVSIGGYFKMPYLTPRWLKEAGQPYGTSQCILALGDMQQANRMEIVKTMAQEIAINPPLLIADDGVLSKPKMGPGAWNFGALSADGKPLMAPMPNGAKLDWAEVSIESVRERVQAAFFLNLINLPISANMTATEYLSRQQERFRIMGPMAGRLEAEYCNPLIDFMYDVILQSGHIEVPEVLQGVELKVEYLGPLARAQKNQDAYSFLQFLETVMPMIDMDPEVLDNLDMDAQFRYHMKLFGTAKGTLRSREDVEKVRDSRDKVATQQEQQVQDMTNVTAIKDLARADYDLRRA